jgi:ribosomal protein L31
MRKNLHPLLHSMVAVNRSGASSSFLSVLRSTEPLVLQTDKTSHPAWTGEREGVSMEDERIRKMLSKFPVWSSGLQGDAGASGDTGTKKTD